MATIPAAGPTAMMASTAGQPKASAIAGVTDARYFREHSIPAYGFSPFVLDGTDCDDADINIHPGATELCDGVDNDCNLLVDDGIAFFDKLNQRQMLLVNHMLAFQAPVLFTEFKQTLAQDINMI